MAVIVPRWAGVTWSDTFTRANQSALGNGWTLGNGTTEPAISSNTATYTGSTAGYYPALYPQPVRTDRFYAQVMLGTPTASGVAVMIRCNSGFTQQVAAFASSASTSSAILFVKNGTGSSSTSEASTTGTWSSGQFLTIACAGNVYSMYRSSTPAWQSTASILSWTDSGATTSIGVGFRLGGIAVQYTPASGPVSNFVLSDY
jgi:hypothetical protein